MAAITTSIYFVLATLYVSEYLSRCVGCKVLWSADGVPFDGRPFCVAGRQQMDCRFGPLRRKKPAQNKVWLCVLCINGHCSNTAVT